MKLVFARKVAVIDPDVMALDLWIRSGGRIDHRVLIGFSASIFSPFPSIVTESSVVASREEGHIIVVMMALFCARISLNSSRCVSCVVVVLQQTDRRRVQLFLAMWREVKSCDA